MSNILRYTPEELDFLDKVKNTVEQIDRSPEIQDILFMRNDFLKLARFFLKGHGIYDHRH
jgi:hypothetical protein